jgi:hypothetical protein
VELFLHSYLAWREAGGKEGDEERFVGDLLKRILPEEMEKWLTAGCTRQRHFQRGRLKGIPVALFDEYK